MFTFKEWILSDYTNNPSIQQQWGALHIIVLALCIATIVAFAFIFRKRSEKTRRIVVFTLGMVILFFEIVRRILNIYKGNITDFDSALYTLLPRPWCAISCWALISSVFVNKKFYYNFASISALICAVIFFAYPGAGFNNKYMFFENIYSISTHALLLIMSITLITLKQTDFSYTKDKSFIKGAFGTIMCFVGVYLYSMVEILAGIESDPLYYMPGNDVMEILGVPHAGYVVIYIAFVCIFFNAFYLIQYFVTKHKKKKEETEEAPVSVA